MKKSKKKFAVLLTASLLAVSCAGIIAASALSNGNEDNPYYKAGEIQQEKPGVNAPLNQNETDAAFVGDHITISRRELDAAARQNAELGIENPEESAYNSLVRREVMQYKAAEEGYTASDEEVNQEIASLKEAFSQAENAENFQLYLAGLGVSEEEYWASQPESVRKVLATNKFIADLRQAYIEENGVKTFDDDFYNAWEAWLEDYRQNLIAQEHIREIPQNGETSQEEPAASSQALTE